MSEKANIDGKKKRIFIMMAILVILLFVLCYVYARKMSNKVYSEYKVTSEINLTHLDSVVNSDGYKAFGNGIIRYKIGRASCRERV